MNQMDALAFLLAHDATRNGIVGAEPWDRPRRRRRRSENRAARIRR